uniref:Transmembrane protein n=1 Tax=Caenorhabditis tropicalis TaxID=1561998 RepID=A0A1I7TI01_9PELO
MLRFWRKALLDCDCMSTVVHITHPFVSIYLLAIGAGSMWMTNRGYMIWERFKEVVPFIIYVIAPFWCAVFLLMLFVEWRLEGKSNYVKCREIAIGLSLAFLSSCLFSQLVVPGIPPFFIAYRNLTKSCTIFCIIHILIAIGLEYLLCQLNNDLSPHPSFVCHILWFACYMPMTWDFWFAFRWQIELGKDA